MDSTAADRASLGHLYSLIHPVYSRSNRLRTTNDTLSAYRPIGYRLTNPVFCFLADYRIKSAGTSLALEVSLGLALELSGSPRPRVFSPSTPHRRARQQPTTLQIAKLRRLQVDGGTLSLPSKLQARSQRLLASQEICAAAHRRLGPINGQVRPFKRRRQEQDTQLLASSRRVEPYLQLPRRVRVKTKAEADGEGNKHGPWLSTSSAKPRLVPKPVAEEATDVVGTIRGTVAVGEVDETPPCYSLAKEVEGVRIGARMWWLARWIAVPSP